MANSGKTTTSAAAAVLALLLATAVFGTASASTLTAFSGQGCAGNTEDVNGCGCFSIKGFQSGFHFVFTEGQIAKLYSGSYCDGYSITLNKETRSCYAHNYQSILMIC